MLKVLVCVDDKDADKFNMLGVGLRSQETCQRWSMRTNGKKGCFRCFKTCRQQQQDI